MINIFNVKEDILLEIKNICNNNKNNEMCGIINGKNYNTKIMVGDSFYNIKNIAEKDKQIIDYQMEPNEMFKVLSKTSLLNKKSKVDFVCQWHSHPKSKGIPSLVDLKTAQYNVVYLIFGLFDQKFRAWSFNKENNCFEKVYLSTFKNNIYK